MRTFLPLLFFTPALVYAQAPLIGEQTPVTQRQYNAQELQQGQSLFRKNCASCHGWDAEGTVKEWQKRDAQGSYPPPPLNGTAHTWHHSVPVLHRTIRDGTQKLGGSMPPWGGKLNDDEILLIIQWLTSLWPDEIYETWQRQAR